MANKSLEIHPAALEELSSATIWYLERSESAAAKFVREIDEAIELIAVSPNRWPLHEGQTRRYVLRRFPFAIIYREKPTAIQILAIAHGSRRPKYWKDRL
jgi:plasmid stabilization system protein ParE